MSAKKNPAGSVLKILAWEDGISFAILHWTKLVVRLRKIDFILTRMGKGFVDLIKTEVTHNREWRGPVGVACFWA